MLLERRNENERQNEISPTYRFASLYYGERYNDEQPR